VATLFNRSFEFVRLGRPTVDMRGNAVPGEKTTRTVRGTVQPFNGKETVPAVALSRNTGTVKVYSSERLDFRSEDGNGLGYVRCGGFLYELVDELPNLNGLIDHYKYVGCLVPPSQIPDALKEGANNA
jgi:hypothetical protein